MTWQITEGDCVEAMRELDEASVDAIVCDPPYGLEFMGKEWDKFVPERGTSTAGVAAAKFGTDGPFAKARGGTTPPTTRKCQRCEGWTGTFSEARAKRQKRCECLTPLTPGAGSQLLAFQRWSEIWATEALRILKPGGHLLAFGGTRTYHRLACAIEDAGFEIRDSLIWLYGSGFPKSLDVGKAIDKAAGAEREVVGPNPNGRNVEPLRYGGDNARPNLADNPPDLTAPATPEAAQWQGWGTALKPSHEPIVMARKPLTGTVAANVLEHGTGGLNVDGCRIEGEGWSKQDGESGAGFSKDKFMGLMGRGEPTLKNGLRESTSGRWPSNCVLSHLPECVEVGTRKVKGGTAQEPDGKPMERSIYGKTGTLGRTEGYADEDGTETITAWECAEGCPVAALDEQSGERVSGGTPPQRYADKNRNAYGDFKGGEVEGGVGSSSGGASRFFYTAKASRAERNAGLEGLPEGHLAGHNKWTDVDYRKGEGEITAKPQSNVHPTVKPIDLMRWLVRLVCPPGGRVLDPFTGSGTTGVACVLEGFDFIGCEREAEYAAIARARIAWWESHAGRDTAAVLIEAGLSERLEREHRDRGQLGLLEGAA